MITINDKHELKEPPRGLVDFIMSAFYVVQEMLEDTQTEWYFVAATWTTEIPHRGFVIMENRTDHRQAIILMQYISPLNRDNKFICQVRLPDQKFIREMLAQHAQEFDIDPVDVNIAMTQLFPAAN